jgi:hypothetical protein
MASTFRWREKKRWRVSPAHYYRHFNPPMFNSTPFSWQHTKCGDYIKKEIRDDGTYPPSDFNLERVTMRCPITHGERRDDNGDLVLKLNGRPEIVWPFEPSIGWQNVENGLTDNDFIRELLANTNPFRPSISVPVMIAELAEAALLLKLSAKSLLALPGSTYLNVKFGWETLIQDIYTLAKVTKQLEYRIREFNSIVKKGGLRRKIRLGNFRWTGAYIKDHTLGSDFFFVIKANRQTFYTSEVWGSVRWRPKGWKLTDEIPIAPLQAFNSAVTAVLDLGALDHHTIWQMIPFSWLVDYFVDVSSAMLAVQDNGIVEPYDICIMRHRTSLTLYQPGDLPNEGNDKCTMTNGSCELDRKLRTVRNSAPDYEDLLRFGWFTPNQAITIAALLTSLKR